MKKRLISLLLTAVMALGLTACGGAGTGGGGGHMTVTIEGNKCNLSGDFQDVVGDIVKDDIHVRSTTAQSEFDEDGYLQWIEDIKVLRDEKSIYAQEQQKHGIYEGEPVDEIIYQYFEISTGNVEYKTADGITNESDADDAEDLKGYVAQEGYKDRGNKAYAAFYVDGKIVDLTEYNDELEDLLEDMEDGTPSNEIMMGHFHWLSLFADTRFAKSANYAMFLDSQYPYFEENMLLAFAFMDAGEKLLDGDIDSYTMIVYEYNEDDDGDAMWTYYYNYYRDKNFDSNKFNPNK